LFIKNNLNLLQNTYSNCFLYYRDRLLCNCISPIHTYERVISTFLIYLSVVNTHEERHKLTLFYEKFKRRLTFTALNITHNQAMAEDAVHNTFISAMQHKEKILSMDDIDFLKWSVIVVKSKCRDLLRKEKNYADKPLNDFQDILPNDSMPVDEYVSQQEVYKRLKGCIASLDEVNRQILEMKYILQMSMKEIGDELGFTPTQVNSRIARARAKVKNLMGNEVSGIA